MVNYSLNYCWIKISWPKSPKVLLVWTNHNVYFQGNKCCGSSLSFPAVPDVFVSILALQGIQNHLSKNIVLTIWLFPETLSVGSDLPGGRFPQRSPSLPSCTTAKYIHTHGFPHAVPLLGMPFPFSSMVNLASSSALEQILFSHEGKHFPSPSGNCGSNLLLFAIFINLSSLSCHLASLYFIYWSLEPGRSSLRRGICLFPIVLTLSYQYLLLLDFLPQMQYIAHSSLCSPAKN